MTRGETDYRIAPRFLAALTMLMGLWLFARWMWPLIDVVMIGGFFGLTAMLIAMKDKPPPLPPEPPTPDAPPLSEIRDYLRLTTPGLNPDSLNMVADGAQQLASTWVDSGVAANDPSVVSLLFLHQECARRAAAEQAFRDRYVPSAELLAFMQRELDVD